jgi:hypothetical protein
MVIQQDVTINYQICGHMGNSREKSSPALCLQTLNVAPTGSQINRETLDTLENMVPLADHENYYNNKSITRTYI